MDECDATYVAYDITGEPFTREFPLGATTAPPLDYPSETLRAMKQITPKHAVIRRSILSPVTEQAEAR
jgi:hypothetical protein